MFLKNRNNGDIVDVAPQDLINLFHDSVTGRYQAGQELQDPQSFSKADLTFLSGEELPRCWTDPHYRDGQLKR